VKRWPYIFFIVIVLIFKLYLSIFASASIVGQSRIAHWKEIQSTYEAVDSLWAKIKETT